MPINSRNKGAVGERELVQILNDRGMLCRRTVQYCGASGEAADIVCEGLGCHVEVKRTEKLKWRQTLDQVKRDSKGKPWVIMHRQSNMRWVVIMDLEHWIRDSRSAESALAARKAIIDRVGAEIDGTI